MSARLGRVVGVGNVLGVVGWAVAIAPCCFAQTDIERDPAFSSAHVAIEMLLAHDRSIESLSWRQVMEQAASGPQLDSWSMSAAANATSPNEFDLGFRASLDEPAAVTRWRVAGLWSEIDVDRRNRAVMRCRQQGLTSWKQSEDGGLSPVMSVMEAWEAFEDGAMRTWAKRSDEGEIVRVIRGMEAMGAFAIPSPLRALGRRFDVGGRRLGEVLRTAPDLQAAQGVAEDGSILVTLRGTADFGGPWGRFTVVVNMSRGGRPERIEIYDPFSGVLDWRIVVEEYLEVKGIWVPTRAKFGMYELAKGPSGESVNQEFVTKSYAAVHQSLRSSLNVPAGVTLPTDLNDQTVREAWANVLRMTFGPDGPFCRAVVVSWMTVTEILALNDTDWTEGRINAWQVPDDIKPLDLWSEPMWISP